MLAIRSATDAAGNVFLKDTLIALLDRPAPGSSLLAWALRDAQVWPANYQIRSPIYSDVRTAGWSVSQLDAGLKNSLGGMG
jgi:hypothetical protein